MALHETIDAGADEPREREGEPVPGLLLLWTQGGPVLRALPLGRQPVVLGRGAEPLDLDDARMSRRHAEVSFDDGAFAVRDLASRNGTHVDGARLSGDLRSRTARTLRTGGSIFAFRHDVRPYRSGVEVSGGVVVGPLLRAVWTEIADIARAGDVLHIAGPSGSGKELAARHFHRLGPGARGPFVAVNCATIPGALAERLLFGARKGAYSGADTDTEGSLQSADGGTLFLDEIAELDPGVQAKLLRALETREVTPLGSVKSRRVDLRLVSATHGELRRHVAAGRFREDLFFRVARPSVTLPALRERLEEIPWLLRESMAGADARPVDASLVEAALLRPWPGNVRELVIEAREAARRAAAARSDSVDARHLDPRAGREDGDTPGAAALPDRGPAVAAMPERGAADRAAVPDRDALESALARAGGNISQAARDLGLHRTQLRRWMIRFGLPGGGSP